MRQHITSFPLFLILAVDGIDFMVFSLRGKKFICEVRYFLFKGKNGMVLSERSSNQPKSTKDLLAQSTWFLCNLQRFHNEQGHQDAHLDRMDYFSTKKSPVSKEHRAGLLIFLNMLLIKGSR